MFYKNIKVIIRNLIHKIRKKTRIKIEVVFINNFRSIRVAKYIRLSRDDGDDRESESVENQRDIIDNYIQEHKELIEVGEYVDDGYTGTNFNRPGFQKMLQDIKKEKVDCIITKDLSRFGRDHIDTGYYLERYLPANNIRYIAIRRQCRYIKIRWIAISNI